MARPIRQAISTPGASTTLLAVDFYQSPFNMVVGVDASNAVGAVFGLQYSLSDIENLVIPPAGAVQNVTVTPLWRNDASIPAGSTANLTSNYTAPVTAVRLVVTALTSGTIYLELLQGMNSTN
jgi:hypothetical protein